MIFEYFLVLTMLSGGFPLHTYTPGTDTYLLHALTEALHPINGLLFDGPLSISSAKTVPSKNILPSLSEMMYYNYYAASMYYGYNHEDLDCEYCLKYRPDVTNHTVINNNLHNTLALVTISKSREEIVVAIRGTFNIWNVILDLDAINGKIPGQTNDVRVHRGFYILTMSIYKDIVRVVARYLKEYSGAVKRIVLAGHSLGAAMARLTFYFMKTLNQFLGVKYGIFTYGEPRVGNKAYADFMNSQRVISANVVARADLFPHLPPTSVLGLRILGDYYYRLQTEYWINGRSHQTFCNQSVYEDPDCSNSEGPLYSFIDHLFYFDVDLSSLLGQPLQLTALPFDIFNPIKEIPPLPNVIEELIVDVLQPVSRILSPLLG